MKEGNNLRPAGFESGVVCVSSLNSSIVVLLLGVGSGEGFER
jgi:hypothetical protein